MRVFDIANLATSSISPHGTHGTHGAHGAASIQWARLSSRAQKLTMTHTNYHPGELCLVVVFKFRP